MYAEGKEEGERADSQPSSAPYFAPIPSRRKPPSNMDPSVSYRFCTERSSPRGIIDAPTENPTNFEFALEQKLLSLLFVIPHLGDVDIPLVTFFCRLSCWNR